MEESTRNDLSVDVRDNDYLDSPRCLKISDIPQFNDVLKDEEYPAASESVVLSSSFEVTPILGDAVNRMLE